MTSTPRSQTTVVRPRRAALPRVGWGAEALFQPPQWEWAEAADVGWWIRPAWREKLLREGALRLDEWAAQGRLTTVKAGPHRVVYRADLPEGAVYIKHNLVPDLRSKFRQWVRRGKARNEAKRAAHLAALGVTTIVPVALGERRHRRVLLDNFLVTREIAGSVTLQALVEQGRDRAGTADMDGLRRRLARALGELTARLHDGGYLHADFHPGNILVTLDAHGRPHLAMIDLDALRQPRRLPPRAAMANLAVLNHYFWTRSTRSDRLRFLQAYLRSRRERLGSARAFAQGIEQETRRWAERLWRRWGKRCRGTNKYFETAATERCRGVASRRLDRAEFARLLDDPDEPFRRDDVVVLKRSRTTTVVEIALRVDQRPQAVIYKRFNRKKRLDPLLNLFRPSRGWRAWQNGQHLSARGVATPANLAVILQGGKRPGLLRRLPRDTYLVTLKAEPAVTLGKYALEILPGLDDEARRAQLRRLLPALARLIRRLHERSLSHRDLKAANILIEGDPRADDPVLSLIDLVGVTLGPGVSHHRRIQNLARLQISLGAVPGRTRTDSLRFLRAYEPRSRTDPARWKRLWVEVDRACRRKEQQNHRRNRRLS